MALSRRLIPLLAIVCSSMALLSAAALANAHQSLSHEAFPHLGRSCPGTNSRRSHHHRGACTRRVHRHNLRRSFAASSTGLSFGKTTVGGSVRQLSLVTQAGEPVRAPDEWIGDGVDRVPDADLDRWTAGH